MVRPLGAADFSCLDGVFDFVQQHDSGPLSVSCAHVAELALFGCLLAWVDFDLTRTWQETIVASDASPSFGFGVSVVAPAPDLMWCFAREATRAGAHARLDCNLLYIDDENTKSRLGRACRLPLSKDAFSTVVSSRAVHGAHAGALEAGGVRLALRWILRSAARPQEGRFFWSMHKPCWEPLRRGARRPRRFNAR